MTNSILSEELIRGFNDEVLDDLICRLRIEREYRDEQSRLDNLEYIDLKSYDKAGEHRAHDLPF